MNNFCQPVLHYQGLGGPFGFFIGLGTLGLGGSLGFDGPLSFAGSLGFGGGCTFDGACGGPGFCNSLLYEPEAKALVIAGAYPARITKAMVMMIVFTGLWIKN